MSERSFIGLDAHARSVSAGVLDAWSGEVRSCSAPTRKAISTVSHGDGGKIVGSDRVEAARR